jgi:hypothetical protein
MSRTITEQLRKLVNEETLGKLAPFVGYFGDLAHNGCWGTYWTTSVEDVRKYDGFIVLLVDQHTWSDSGGGIEMSVRVFVVSEGTLSISDKLVYRHHTDQKRDRWELYYRKILDARSIEGKYRIGLENTKGYPGYINI